MSGARRGGPEPSAKSAALKRTAAREAPLVLMLSAAHPPTDLRIVGKEGAALAEAGWRVTHLAPAPLRGARDVPQSQAGVEIVTYPRPSGWIGRLRAARALAKRAARLKPDVIHAHEPDSWYAAILAARQTGAAVVLDVHEHYPSRLDARLPGLFRGLGRKAVRAACRWMAARADAVVVAKDGLEDAFPEAEVVPVRNYAAAVPVEPRAHRHGPVTLTHLGALTRERGAFEMLRALARCPEGTRLSLIGRFTDASETDFLSEAKRLGLAGAVERHGWLPHEAAVQRAAEADIGLVLFQPGVENHRLALPHKLFDCMLAGLPIIVPDFAEEVAAVVRDTGCGVLVDTADPDTVAEAVRALADPHLRAEMGAAGRAAALGRFGWAGEAERLIRLYQELAPLPQAERPRDVAPMAAAPGQPAAEAVPEPSAAPGPSVPEPVHSAPVQLSPTPPAPVQPMPAQAPEPVPAPAPAPVPAPVAARPAERVAPPVIPAPRPAPMQAPAPSAADAFAHLSAAIRGARPHSPSPEPAGLTGEAAPRLLLDAALGAAQEVPPVLAALLARQEAEPAPGPSPVLLPGELPPPSQVLGPMPEAVPGVLPMASAPTPSAALGSMVQALRAGAPPVPRPAAPAEPVFSLLAGMREASEAPSPPPDTPRPVPKPPEPVLSELTGRAIPAAPERGAPETGAPRLLSEAGLSGGRGLPASVAALLARDAAAVAEAPALPPIASDVPLVEAGLRLADRRAPDPVPPEWRLLQAMAAPQPAGVAQPAEGR
ncbi:Glycosyltransferase involved in cell wall bisynthesis [Roseomonas rosea]|uniref:Glycosyltransferase involved in cell wall bisynthesis n=1 Tax=Muricoccus roseus TaxID=198092 RepID=A0A1M6I8G7_9PROT|nr:glycosyltransferase [Roseomonas rosea]SHJ30771.1 Glycosyltransferase involved in cell wall bisynthesis [Roseomonas rosea]